MTAAHSVDAEDAMPIPDLSGTWARQAFFFEPPPSGPGPVTNSMRFPNGHSDLGQLVGDYTNPILKPDAAEVVKRRGEIALGGMTARDPSNQCLPMSTPYILGEEQEIQILQQKDQITILYMADHQVRRVRMNAQHPARVTPTWSGDSVGHYEGDTLVVDTIGIRAGPLSMVDWFGTPQTADLHVVERYRLIDYDAARRATESAIADQGYRVAGDLSEGVVFDPNYIGKGLQIQFTVEDANVFTAPWSARLTYRRAGTAWQESVCAENTHEYYSGNDTAVPTADRPDF
jgi:hypothetical protein